MRILQTGANGFLGSVMVEVLQGYHEVIPFDIQFSDNVEGAVEADVSDFEQVQSALESRDVDGLIIGHMAPHPYDKPHPGFDINVKGTANLLYAGYEAGLRKFCLISSVGVHQQWLEEGKYITNDMAYRSNSIYTMSKVAQEVVCEQFYQAHKDVSITALRIGYVVNANKGMDKYGREIDSFTSDMVDPYDVATCAMKALDKGEKGFNAYYVVGSNENDYCDMQKTKDAFNWEAKYTKDSSRALNVG